MLAAELAKWLDIRGPAVTVAAADSSSISALHMAILDLEARKCQYAIIAGRKSVCIEGFFCTNTLKVLIILFCLSLRILLMSPA